MPRTKQFDRDETLHKAMELFWEKGYYDTSVQDLVDHLGINRASIYDTFGGKDELFFSALKLYRNQNEGPVKGIHYRPGELHQILRAFWDGVLNDCLGEGAQKGCFIANSTIDLSAKEETISHQVFELAQKNMEGFVSKFEQLFREAKTAGELQPETSPRALARYMFNTVNGLRIIARADNRREVLEDIIDTALLAVR